MKILIFLALVLPLSLLGKSTNLNSGMRPTHYQKRESATFNIGLAYYGDFWKEDDLRRIAPLLKERFELATNGLIKLNIIGLDVLSFKTKYDPIFMNKEYPHIKDPERLQRIFYYETVNAKVMSEAYEEFKKSKIGKSYHLMDALLVITGAQFEGLGFANGRIAVTEQPREIAWAIPSGRTEIVSDESIVDELIHELGHTMFLGHTSTQCQKPGMTLEQKRQCCEASPSKNDVMSYCRSRGSVGQDQMFGFESCNLEMISQLIIPAMLKGKRWNIRGRKRCL
ncbi:MAG: hypothetical protein GY909_16905 [Oligoflexia bacterium]|nr:hypothetical protein [Oligoflexia bacterium]